MRPARRPIPRKRQFLPGSSSILLVTMTATACAGGAAGGPPAEEPTPDADGVITTRSGLKYKVLAEGTGPKPTARDRVLVDYYCALTDGTVVDSSYARGQPDELALRDLIRGFREALQLMSVGSHLRIAVPAHLAYGREGVEGAIGPNEPLIFEIELHRILGR